MATTFTIKRKTFSNQDGEKKGMSTAGKVLAGTAAAAGTFALARRGGLGVNAAKYTNKAWGKAGQALQKSSAGSFQKMGASMEKGALKANGKVVFNDAVKTLEGTGSAREIKRLAGQEARQANAALLA